MDQESKNGEVISIVSGLPRSGTSMMMRMLNAGGMEVAVDGIRKPDPDNPNGYYEYEQVKRVREDVSWIPETRGKVFKMVSLLLFHLPKNFEYRVVLMRRNVSEILASQKAMLERNGKPYDPGQDGKMKELFERHLDGLDQWLKEQNHIRFIEVWYDEVIHQTETAVKRVGGFLPGDLNEEAMVRVVDGKLYRQRA